MRAMGRGCGGRALEPLEERAALPSCSPRKANEKPHKRSSRLGNHATTALKRSRENHATASRAHNARRPQLAVAKAADWRVAGVRVKYRAF
jgi:hypothetical protein